MDNPEPGARPVGAATTARWPAIAAGAALTALTLIALAVYAVKPQSPRDFSDRVQLALAPDRYGPNLRVGDRWLGRAVRADAAGADSLAGAFRWRAVRSLGRAAAGAPSAQEQLTANDRLAGVYLDLGWRYLERGQGRAFGLGRRWDELNAAENIAGCVVGLAPTRLRAQINAFVVQLEKALDRPPAGRCPG